MRSAHIAPMYTALLALALCLAPGCQQPADQPVVVQEPAPEPAPKPAAQPAPEEEVADVVPESPAPAAEPAAPPENLPWTWRLRGGIQVAEVPVPEELQGEVDTAWAITGLHAEYADGEVPPALWVVEAEEVQPGQTGVSRLYLWKDPWAALDGHLVLQVGRHGNTPADHTNVEIHEIPDTPQPIQAERIFEHRHDELRLSLTGFLDEEATIYVAGVSVGIE